MVSVLPLASTEVSLLSVAALVRRGLAAWQCMGGCVLSPATDPPAVTRDMVATGADLEVPLAIRWS